MKWGSLALALVMLMGPRFALAFPILVPNGSHCQHLIELAMLEPSDNGDYWPPAALLQSTVNGEGEARLKAMGALQRAVVERLIENSTRFSFETAEDSSTVHFSIRIHPDNETPLGRLASELERRGLKLHLASCASNGHCVSLDHHSIFKVRLPLETVALSMAEVNTLRKEIEELYDLQEERILRASFKYPTTTQAWPDGTGSQSHTVYHSPAFLTFPTRYAIRTQRRFRLRADQSAEREIETLHFVAENLRELRERSTDIHAHADFARALQVYLTATGLPTDLVKSETGIGYDIRLRAVGRDEWDEKFSRFDSMAFPIRTSPNFEYPELIKMAVKFQERDQYIGWNTNSWLEGKEGWIVEPFDDKQSKRAIRPVWQKTDHSSIFLLPTREVYREKPTYLTRIFVHEHLKELDSRQISFLSDRAEDGREYLVGVSVGREIMEQSRLLLKKLMAFRYSFLPRDLRAIADFQFKELQRLVDIFGARNRAMQDLLHRLDDARPISVAKEGKVLRVVFRTNGGIDETLFIRDPGFAKALEDDFSVTNEKFIAYIRVLKISRREEFDAMADELLDSARLLHEAEPIISAIPMQMNETYPGTKDWYDERQAEATREHNSPVARILKTDQDSGPTAFLIKSFGLLDPERGDLYQAGLNDLIRKFKFDEENVLKVYGQLSAYLRREFPHLQTNVKFDRSLRGWFDILKALRKQQPQEVEIILSDMILHPYSQESLVAALRIYSQLDLKKDTLAMIGGALRDHYFKAQQSVVHNHTYVIAWYWLKFQKDAAAPALWNYFKTARQVERLKILRLYTQFEVNNAELVEYLLHEVSQPYVQPIEYWMYLAAQPGARVADVQAKVGAWMVSREPNARELELSWRVVRTSKLHFDDALVAHMIKQYDELKSVELGQTVIFLQALYRARPRHPKLAKYVSRATADVLKQHKKTPERSSWLDLARVALILREVDPVNAQLGQIKALALEKRTAFDNEFEKGSDVAGWNRQIKIDFFEKFGIAE